MSNSSRNQLSIDLQAEKGPVITLRNGIHKQRCNFNISTPDAGRGIKYGNRHRNQTAE